jgi:two-component system, response regulator
MTDSIPCDILLVEDNPHDADLTIRAFRRHGLANRILVLEDGIEALDYIFCRGAYGSRLADLPPRVILLDIKLPKVDGLEVLRQIKADPQIKAIPVVMLTSSREDPDLRRAYSLGANSYVVKPVEFTAFSEAIHNLGLYWLLVNEPLAGRGMQTRDSTERTRREEVPPAMEGSDDTFT